MLPANEKGSCAGRIRKHTAFSHYKTFAGGVEERLRNGCGDTVTLRRLAHFAGRPEAKSDEKDRGWMGSSGSPRYLIMTRRGTRVRFFPLLCSKFALHTTGGCMILATETFDGVRLAQNVLFRRRTDGS